MQTLTENDSARTVSQKDSRESSPSQNQENNASTVANNGKFSVGVMCTSQLSVYLYLCTDSAESTTESGANADTRHTANKDSVKTYGCESSVDFYESVDFCDSSVDLFFEGSTFANRLTFAT